ncbi:MAG: CoA transferase [Pseudomonadota bacterium]
MSTEPSHKVHRREYDPTFSGPLAGVRVLDLSRLVAGNMLSLQLADYGGEVIKVEPKAGDPLRHWRPFDVPITWIVYGRNKKSLGLELRSDVGKSLLLKLVATAGVFIENFRPGTLEKMGLGEDVLLDANPNLIIVRVSGFGQTGPYRHRPGFGTLVEAMSGFAYRNGFEDREPVLPPLAMADMIAGIQGAMAVMMALRNIEMNGGCGQVIDLSLLEPIFSIMGAEAAWHDLSGTIRERTGSGSTTASPRNVYKTKDGKWLAMSGSMQSMAERIFQVIGRADMITDPRYLTNEDRVAHREEVDAAVGGWIATRTLEENMAVFERENVTVAPVYDIEQICHDQHFIEREIVVELPDDELGHVKHHNVVPRMSGTPGGFTRAAPSFGEHNREILTGLGLSGTDIDELRRDGVIFEDSN